MTKLPKEIRTEIQFQESKIGQMTDYLTLKLEEGDYHGVEDAASDIRDIVAKIEALTWVLGEEKH